jgi:hypothetical protein
MSVVRLLKRMESHRIQSESGMKAEGPLLKYCHVDHKRQKLEDKWEDRLYCNLLCNMQHMWLERRKKNSHKLTTLWWGTSLDCHNLNQHAHMFFCHTVKCFIAYSIVLFW